MTRPFRRPAHSTGPVSADGTSGDGRGMLTNAGALVSSRLVVAVLGWAGSLLIVRTLSPQEWGEFSFIFTVLGMLSFMTSLGSARIVLAELARGTGDSGAYAGTYVVLRAALGAGAYATAVGFVVAAGYPASIVQGTAVAGVVLVIAAAGSGLDVVFQSRMRLGPVAVASVVGQVGQLALTVLVTVTRPSLLLFVLPALAYDVVAAGWKVRAVRPLMRLRLHVDLATWRSILVQAAPIAAGHACLTLALSVDAVVLSQVDTFVAVGELAVADKFVLVVGFIPLALEPPLIALLARAWPDRPAAFHRTLRRGTLLMTVAAGLVLVGFVPVAGDIVSLLYGEEYRGVATAAQLSVLATCLSFYSYVLFGALVAVGRNRLYLLLSATVLAVTVLASVVLVPRYAVVGAGLARVAAASLVLLVLVVVARRQFAEPVARGRQHLLTLAVCLVVLGAGRAAADALPWPLVAAGCPVLYLGLLHVTRACGPAGLRSLLHEEPVDAEPVPGTR